MSFESDCHSGTNYTQGSSPSDFDLLEQEIQYLKINFPPSLRLRPTEDP